MAVIGSIRRRATLLLLLIGTAIVSFIVMDFTNSQSSILRGRKDSVGNINGEKIAINDYNKKYEENVKNMETQMRSSIGEDQRNMIRNQTWNEMVNDIIFNKIYDKLGIGVTSEELNDLFTSPENASPDIQRDQQFRNPQTGQFDPAQVRMYVSRLDQDPEGVEPGTLRKQWLNFESYLKKKQFQEKYDNLISKALFVPTWQAEMGYNDQMRLVDFRYIQVPYSDVNDADVKVSDEDLKKYIDEHKAEFKQDDETRKLEYVTFDIFPSAADSAKTILALEERREEFAKGATASDDSVFVKIYSETPFDDVYYDKDKISSPVKDTLFKVPVKTVIGPYLDGKSYKLAKVSDRKMISDSVHVREIVISFNNATSSQEAFNARFKQLDSIYRQLDSLKGDFGAFAFAFSDDQMGKMKGGDIGWVKQGEKEKMYNDLIFYRAQKGKIYKVPVQAENAIHIVQVVEDRPSKMGVQVAYFSTEIVPSEETQKSIYSTATTFAADNQNEAKFKEASKKLNAKTVDVKKDDFNVMGAGSARDMVKWAYNAKKGDVSSIFPLDKKHVVAMLVEIHPKGIQDVDAVREQVKAEVTKKKKFDLLSKKINDAKAASIDDLAAKLGKTPAQADKVSFMSPNLNGMPEPSVVAVALNTAAGKLSGPIEGYTGVYVVQNMGIQEPAKITDYSAAVMQMKSQIQGKSRYAQDVQRKLANIDDNRFDFF